MKPSYSILLISIFICSCAFTQKMQQDFQVFENAKFENFTIENGLPSDFCLKTCESPDHSIWVASMHGIAKFNGFKWDYFQQESSSKSKRIGSNWVMDIFPTSSKIWYHTDKDVGYIDLKKFKTIPISTISNGWGKLTSNKNDVFVSTWKGIIKYNKKKWKKVSDELYDECKEFVTINGEIYTYNTYTVGFYSYNRKKKIFVHHQFVYGKQNKKSTLKIINALAYNSHILAVTEKNGIVIIDPKTRVYKTIIQAAELKKFTPTCLLPYKFKHQNFIVIGTNDHGIVIVDLKKNKQINCLPIPELKEQTIASKKVHHLFRDSKNGIWIATDKGLSYFSPENQLTRTTYFYQNKVIPDDALITALQPINEQELLIGTKQNGVFLSNSNTLKTHKIPLRDRATINFISPLIQGHYFIATARSVYCYNRKSNQLQWLNLPVKNCLKIRELESNNIGLSSDYGVLIYNYLSQKIIFKEPIQKDELKNSNHITLDFIEDSCNNLWVLRKQNGLYTYNLKNTNFTKITPKKFFKDGIDFHSMSFDKKTNKIVVASSSGIFIHSIYNPKELIVLNSKNGLNGDFINYAALRNNGELYYSTINGLYAYQFKHRKSITLFNFGQYERKENPLFEIYKHTILIPISNYYIQYFEQFPSPTKINQPQLNSLVIGSKSMPLNTDEIQLNYSNRHLELLFNATSYLKNKKMILEYQLGPINKHWIEINNGSLEFIELEPSNYILKIRWRDLSTNKTSKLLLKKITINSPFYLKWWFYLMVSLGISFVLFIIYKMKIKTKEQILATRLQISLDLHDELGANISSINILTHLISNVLSVDSPTQKFMQQLKENSSSINETINDIIWNVNPRFDKLNDIVLRVKRYASPLLESACIQVTYDIQLTDENNVIEQHIKYNLYLLIKESINNCAKYSNATAVSIKIHSVGKWIYYEIKDDGIGFDLETKKNNGNGLLNMQTRALAIHGKLTIETAPNNGTKIILILK